MFLSDFQKELIEDIIKLGRYDVFELLYQHIIDKGNRNIRDSNHFKREILASSNFNKAEYPQFFIKLEPVIARKYISEYICLIEFLKNANLIVLKSSNSENALILQVSNPLDTKISDYINYELLTKINRILVIPTLELKEFASPENINQYKTQDEIKNDEEKEDRRKSLKYTRIALYITTFAIIVNVIIELFRLLCK